MSPPMSISKRYVTAVAFLGIVLILTFRPWQSKSPGNPKSHEALHGTAITDEAPPISPGLGESTRTKSRIRTNHSKVTIEETTGLLRTTIIPTIDLPPDQLLSERIARINELIQKAGMEPYRLRLIIRSGDPALQWRCRGELGMREVPVAVAVKYIIDSTKLRYYIRENGIVELTTMRDQDLLPDVPDPPEKTVRPPPGETDTFGNDPNAPEEPDPFANPPAP